MKKVSKCMAVLATLSLVFSLFFACKQSSDDEVVLSRISVTLKDESKVFKTGDELKVEDVLVKAMYSDESERDVTKEAAFDPELPHTIENSMSVKVSYGGKTASLPIAIEANEIEKISIKRADSTKTFFVGDEISEKDFVVAAKYKDGTLKVLSEGVVFSGLGVLQKGTVKITATYNDFEAYCEVIVISEDDLNDVENLKGITLALKEGKTFVEGGEISKADFTVTATYSNDTENDVTEKALFTGFVDSLPAGFVTITAQYGLATCSLVIPVSKKNSEYDEIKGEDGSTIKLTGITLDLKEGKAFVEGDKVSKDDLVVTAKYSNGSSKTVTDGVEFDGIDEELVAGQAVIWAIYGSKHASLDIFVSAKPGEAILEEISITLKEIKTFVEGETISASDFVVTAKYSDGKVKVVTETNGVEFTKGLGVAQAGNITVVVTYLTKTAFKTITVVEKPVDDSETPDALYIVGDFNNWDFEDGIIPMKKDGNCFYYEFQEAGIIGFKICKAQGWNGQVFGGVAIPQTGVYVAPNLNVNLIYTENATVYIANPGDRIYVRYKDGTYYARYAAKGEVVNPNEEMEVVPAIEFDVRGLPSYAFENESYVMDIGEDENIPCKYTYQWYRYKEGEASSLVSGATSKSSPTFVEGYYYYCAVTATAIENSKNTITKTTNYCYIDTDEITVSFLESEVTFADGENSKELTAQISTNWYDEIKWNSSAPLVAAVDANGNMASIRTIGNGEAIITVTVVRRGQEESATCKVIVGNVKSVWWYYVLDTSKVSKTPVDSLNFIFNLGNGAAQTADITDVQSTGEIAYKWNGIHYGILGGIGGANENSVFEEIVVDESARQNGLDTEKSLVVYLCMPEGYSPIYIYSWIKVEVEVLDENGESYNYIESRDLTKTWPGDPMILCEVNDTNSVE